MDPISLNDRRYPSSNPVRCEIAGCSLHCGTRPGTQEHLKTAGTHSQPHKFLGVSRGPTDGLKKSSERARTHRWPKKGPGPTAAAASRGDPQLPPGDPRLTFHLLCALAFELVSATTPGVLCSIGRKLVLLTSTQEPRNHRFAPSDRRKPTKMINSY